MNAKRILKEARPVFWPWCAVTLACVIPLVRPLPSIAWVGAVGFFVGIPLLASLAFGNEFQHRTLSLLLSQPVGRMEIWREKMSITVVAVVAAALVFSLALRVTSFRPDWKGLAFAGVWVVATIASATFWTLIARSTVGGVALTIVGQFLIILALGLAYRLHGTGYISPTYLTVVPTVTFLGCAGVMLWLGRRTLARFQGTGGMDDLLMAGPDVMPGAWARWLSCRSSGAVLNLIRKELRLLRPVWLISLLAALGWACLTLFGLLFERGFSRNFETAVISAGVISTLIIAILAGSLSMGEERTSGTHAWQMTLPVSALLQWRIKLYMALFAGFVGAGLIPLLITRRSLLGFPSMIADAYLGGSWLLSVVLLTFASFWCACAVKGTVRAVLWVFPVLIAIGLASEFGAQAGPKLINLFVSKFDPFANFRFTNAVVSLLDPARHSGFAHFLFENIMWADTHSVPVLTFLLAPTLLLAVIQSYRLFRAPLQDNSLSLIRRLLPLAVVAFLCSFSFAAFFAFVGGAITRQNTGLWETIEAVAKIDLGTANVDVNHPVQLNVDDLAKIQTISKDTRRWLGNSRVTIVPITALPHCCARDTPRNPLALDDAHSWYLTTIYLPSGSDCTQSGQRWNHDVRMLVVICK